MKTHRLALGAIALTMLGCAPLFDSEALESSEARLGPSDLPVAADAGIDDPPPVSADAGIDDPPPVSADASIDDPPPVSADAGIDDPPPHPSASRRRIGASR